MAGYPGHPPHKGGYPESRRAAGSPVGALVSSLIPGAGKRKTTTTTTHYGGGPSYGGGPAPGYGGQYNYQSGYGQSGHSSHGRGMGSNLAKTGGALLTGAGKLFGSAVTKGKEYVDEWTRSPTLDLLQNGNVVQLISRCTGRALQIMQTPEGQLFLDANGNEGPAVMNAHFTVTRLDKTNCVQLHNNGNYIAIAGGVVTFQRQEPGHPIIPTTVFKIKETESQFISLKSDYETGCLGVLPNGGIKSPIATSRTDGEAQFGVRLVYSPYATPPPPPVAQYNVATAPPPSPYGGGMPQPRPY